MIEVKIKSKVKTENIDFNLNDNESSDLLVQSFNYYPYVFLKNIDNNNGININPQDIIFIKLTNSDFLPTIEMVCYDSNGFMYNDLYPFDHDTLICLFVKSNSELTFPIRMDFMVTSYEIIKNDSEEKTVKYRLKGILNVDALHYARYETKKGTSFDILKDISSQLNLGWATNETTSNDNMTWINPQETYLNFIKEITENAYIDDDSFIWTFIDFQYNLTYVNLQKELNEYNKDEKGMMTNNQVVRTSEEKTVPLFLSNNSFYKTTNKYITKYNLLNQSFKINLEKGYQQKITWYDKTDNTVYKPYIQNLKTNNSKLGSSGELNSLLDEDSRLFIENIKDETFTGKFDTENNVHKKFAYTKANNKYNLESLEKIKMILTLEQVNFSIKRFQNIKIDIYNISANKDINTEKAGDNINRKLSGYWFVTGINYIFKRSGGVEEEITVMRRNLSINYDDAALKLD